jgi:hypothetical protein
LTVEQHARVYAGAPKPFDSPGKSLTDYSLALAASLYGRSITVDGSGMAGGSLCSIGSISPHR